MTRIALTSLLAFGLVCMLTARIALAEEVKCEGTIAKIEGNSVTVKTADAEHQLTCTPTTKITLDGKPAKSTDLKVGYKVKCAGNKEGAKAMCTSIDATTAN